MIISFLWSHISLNSKFCKLCCVWQCSLVTCHQTRKADQSKHEFVFQDNNEMMQLLSADNKDNSSKISLWKQLHNINKYLKSNQHLVLSKQVPPPSFQWCAAKATLNTWWMLRGHPAYSALFGPVPPSWQWPPPWWRCLEPSPHQPPPLTPQSAPPMGSCCPQHTVAEERGPYMLSPISPPVNSLFFFSLSKDEPRSKEQKLRKNYIWM